MRAAWAGSANLCSSTKVYFCSQSSSCVPWLAITWVCGRWMCGIDQPRQDQMAGMVVDRRAFRQPCQHRGGIAEGRDAAVLDQHDAVLEIGMARRLADLGRVGLEAQDAAAQGPRRHHSAGAPARYQAASMPRSAGSSSVMLAGGIASLAAACR